MMRLSVNLKILLSSPEHKVALKLIVGYRYSTMRDQWCLTTFLTRGGLRAEL